MNVTALLRELDTEIARLQKARETIAALSTGAPAKRGPGRPKATTTVAAPARKKRTMSPEARAKIAAAAKKRWAAQKKATK
ncbi:hypothetical protein ACFQBQ_08845 [Granulicella cerasi]|uniref:Uncharacterized protein n=1 Tax=Granulicella cerasi TaxID=741063 RepID=A0ABW1ZAE5_9BACT|nr:hypothetical protein [Granulicella cerasi]